MKIKRLLEVGFWLGILCACIPILMYAFGNARQYQLRRQWAAHTQAVAQTAESDAAPAPSPVDDGLVRLRIPRLHVDAFVLGDVSNTALAEGPGHFPNSALPGQTGNCAIAAHRNLWGCWFANLDELQPGDEVILETFKKHFVYDVTESRVISPTDNSVLKPHGHDKELTLVTCTIPATHRIVVHGILDHTSTG